MKKVLMYRQENVRLLELPDNKKGGFVVGPSLPTNPLIASSWHKADSRKWRVFP